MAILDIRGTNGAGKSHIVHTLLDQYGRNHIYEGTKVFGYAMTINHWPVGVVGTYENQCGGCDSVKTANEICNRIRTMAKEFKHVICEGITLSHTFQRYHDLSIELGDYHFLYLTTPVEVCIKRVLARRKAKGNTKPFDPYKKMGLVTDYERVQVAYRKLKAAGRNVIDLDYKNPMPQVMELLTCQKKS